MTKLFNRRTALIALILAIIVAGLVFSVRKQRAANSEYFLAPVDHGPLRNVVNKAMWF